MAALDLNAYLDQPGDLSLRPDEDFIPFARRDVEAFQLEAAQRKLKRHAERIPAIGEMVSDRNPASFKRFDDYVPLLMDPDAYKSYDPTLIETKDYAGMTRWLDRYTTFDLAKVDMRGCDNLTEWCARLHSQADIWICHSSGTTGTLSFVPRSAYDRNLLADAMVYRNPNLLTPFGQNDVTYFALGPRRLYRITQAIYDGLEARHHTHPAQMFDVFHSPEFHIAQGRLRVAARKGTTEQVLKDPIVSAYKDEVEAYARDLEARTEAWTDNLINNYRGEKILFQGSFDKAWSITQQFQKLGVTGAFHPDSVFGLTGGVKNGATLPPDWQQQFRAATGVAVDKMSSVWGMSEITGGIYRCVHGQYHFTPTFIAYVLDPATKQPLPRHGVQTGQLAVLELNSSDCWGGMISGDRGTVDWDGVCACGLGGPMLDPDSIGRL
jgi:hypothetical protein